MQKRSNRNRIQTRRKKKKNKRILSFIVIPLIVVILAGVGFAYSLLDQFSEVMDGSYDDVYNRTQSEKRTNEEPLELKKDPFSVLIIGLDDGVARNWGEKSRSDVLILATVNPNDHTVKMMSIPRDSYAFIPSVGYKSRINEAHFFAGPTGTIDTVEYLFDVPVDYYVRLNFQAFMGVVDALGGVEFDVQKSFSVVDSEDNINGITIKKGLQTLNGEQALAVARVRSIDNDFERNKRQQELIKAIIKKTATFGSITKLDDVLEAVGTNMRTNLTSDQMLDIASYGVANGLKLSIETVSLTGKDGSDSRGSYIFVLDEDTIKENKQILRTHLELD